MHRGQVTEGENSMNLNKEVIVLNEEQKKELEEIKSASRNFQRLFSEQLEEEFEGKCSGNEFYAKIDSILNDYEKAMEIIERQNIDIKQLLALLIKEDIPIPEEMLDRYIRKKSKPAVIDQELPF